MSDFYGNAEPEDFQNPRNYCRHGTFIGDPYGGDYLCGYCEDGREPVEVWRWHVKIDQADGAPTYISDLSWKRARHDREAIIQAFLSVGLMPRVTMHRYYAGRR